MKKLNKISQKSKNNKRIVVITYTQNLEDARIIKEKIEDTHPDLGADYCLVKAILFLRELEKLKIRNRKKYDEIKSCSAIWKRLGKHFKNIR